jgi:hypothetical protein
MVGYQKDEEKKIHGSEGLAKKKIDITHKLPTMKN